MLNYPYPQHYVLTPVFPTDRGLIFPQTTGTQPTGTSFQNILQGAQPGNPPSHPSKQVIDNHNYLKSLSPQQFMQVIADKKAGRPIYLPSTEIYRDTDNNETSVALDNRVPATDLLACFGKWANIAIGVPFGTSAPMAAIFLIQQVHTTHTNGWITFDNVNFSLINLPHGLIDVVLFC